MSSKAIKEFEMSKSFTLGFIVGVVLLVVAGAGASRLKQQDAEQQKYQVEIADATPLHLGVMTDRQRFHSRLHNGIGMKVDGKTISEWLASYRGQKVILATDILGRRSLPSDRIETPEDFFGRFAQESDAVIRGRVTGKTSQIT